jgi:two-component system NtrC family sensor kinase
MVWLFTFACHKAPGTPLDQPLRQTTTFATERQAAIRLLRLLSVAAIVLPLLVLGGGSAIAWHNKQIDGWDSTSRLTDLIYESVSKLFAAQLLVLDEAQALTEGLDDDALRAHEADLHPLMASMLKRLPAVRDVFVVGRAGRAIVDGVRFPSPYGNDLSDRDYVQFVRNGGEGLFVSVPALRKVDGRRFFALAIPRRLQNGAFSGVVATSVAPEFFEEYFRQAARAYGDADDRIVALRRGDGQMLVRLTPDGGGAMDDRRFMTMISGTDAMAGRFEVTLQDTGRHWLVAWRRMPEVNMIVLTALDRAAVVRGWASSILTQLYFGVPVTLALFVITLLALRRTNQVAAAEAQAAAEMALREQAEEAVRQSQKMEALGKLTGGVAHDFNNLLAVILGSAELARRRPPDKVGRLLDNIIHAAQRASGLTRQLLSFSRTQNVAPQVVDLRSELPRMVELLRPSLRGDISLSVKVADDLWPTEVDPGEFEIAILNVAVNARDVMPAGGRFSISAMNRTVEGLSLPDEPTLAGAFVVISMTDTGPGMPPAIAARAFEPFFTTKEIGRGTGLGLSQVYGFARQAGGAAAIESQPGRGTTIRLFLPRSLKPIGDDRASVPAAEQGASGRRVLVVEDNSDVAGIVREILVSLGWEVVLAFRAREALQMLDESFDLLLSDVVMPDGMSGLDLARAARLRCPGLPILLASGYRDAVARGEAEFPVLRKPFTLEAVAKAVAQAVGEPVGEGVESRGS